MFPTCKNSQKRVRNQKSTNKHSSFDGLIQEDIDLSDIFLAVHHRLHIRGFFSLATHSTSAVNIEQGSGIIFRTIDPNPEMY